MVSFPVDFATTEENTNYARLCRLLVDVGCTVLRDTFDSIHPPSNLRMVLSSPSVLSKLRCLRKDRVLNLLQWGKLFPGDPSTVSSANFDLRLLLVLLRNICGLRPHFFTYNWAALPAKSDDSLEANLVRIKCYRNDVYAHATKASVDNRTFYALWQKISSAILAIASRTGNCTMYATSISRLKTECMDPAAEAHFLKVLSDWKKDDVSLKEMLQELKDSRMASVPVDFATTQENTNYARLCRLLVDVGCTVLRDTFDSIHSPFSLHMVLSSPSVFSTLQSLLRKRVLNKWQWEQLFPGNPSAVSSANFDAKLLVVLLRSICGLNPPVSTNSWTELPPDSDNSLEANIVRIKCYGTNVYGHDTKASVDDPTFDVLWQRISNAILALASGANNRKMYATAIGRLKTESMDPSTKTRYEVLQSDWKKRDVSSTEVIEKLKEMMKLDERGIQEDLGKMEVTPPEVLFRGPRATEAYYKALEEGKTRVRRIPLMLIGQDRSGKTSLKKSLKGIPFNPLERRTVGIDVDPSYFKVTTETWKIGEEDQATNKETKRYFEYNLGRQILKILKHDTEAQSVSEGNEVTEDPASGILGQDASSMPSLARTLSETEKHDNRVSETTVNRKSYPEQPAETDETLSPPVTLQEMEPLLSDLFEVDEMEGEDDIYSVLWDFAGESVYYETHTLFLTPRAIFLLAYDLSQDPYEKVLFEKRQGRYGVIVDRIGTKTNLDYLDYWMTSVSSVSRHVKDREVHSVLPKTLPCVFLVCTHADQPSGGEDPKVLARKVYGELREKPYGTHLCGKFEVDNTKSGQKPKCVGVSCLREKIREVAQELPQMKEFIPIKWLKFERKLEQFRNNGHQWITIDNAKKTAQNDCQIHDDEEFKTALDFLHDQKFLIHFDNTDELNKFVFLNLQWLIDIMKKVITIKPYDDDEDTEFDGLWKKLQTEGILEEKLLKHVWGPLIREHAVFNSLVEIMEKFSLLCSWPASDDLSSKIYLVPSMLSSHPTEEIIELIASAKLPSLFIKFEPGQVPSRLFPRLVTQFLLLGKEDFWNSLNPQLYHNFARLYISKVDKCSVVLLCHSSLIEIVVHGGNDAFEVSCAQLLFGQLVLILECMRKEFFWLKNMRYQAGVVCTVCCHGRKVKYCRTHGKNDCEREECLHFIPESKLRSADESITCTRAATARDSRVFIKDFSAWLGSCQKRTPDVVDERLAAVSSSRVAGGKKEFCLPSPGDKPPRLRFELKAECDVPTKRWSDDHLPIDILLLAAKYCDFLSCFYFLDQPFKSYKFGIGSVHFGHMGGASDREKLKVALMNYSKGAAIPGVFLTVLQNAFRVLQPKAVFSVGTCISLGLEKVRIGDVVISSKVTTLEGFKTRVGRLSESLVRDAPNGWVAPLKNPDELEVKVHCNGDILSYSLPEMCEYDDICVNDPGAVAIETEGTGNYAAASDVTIEWVIVKGVAGYFHQSKFATPEWMSFASTMAASVVAKMLKDPKVFLEWPHAIQGRGSKSKATYDKVNAGGQTFYVERSRPKDAYDEVNTGRETNPLVAPNSTSGAHVRNSCCSMRCSLM